MRNNKSIKNIMIFLSILILIAISAFIYIILEIKSKNENISKLKNELIVHENESNYLSSMQNMVSNFGQSIELINSSVLNAGEDVLIIETIEGIAQKNGLEVEIDTISVEDVAALKDSGMTTLKIKLTTSGSWSSVYKFISEIESLPYKIKIERNSLTLIDSVDGKVKNWRTTMEVRFLEYK